MSSFSLRFLSACTLAFALALSAQPPAAPGAQAELRQRLVNHPLYLRDAWQEDNLEFDPHGHPLYPAEAHRGPVTLSGIDITSVKLRGNQLRLEGLRVALIAPQPGKPLQRATAIGSTTRIFPSLLPGDKKLYRATEHVQFTLHADANGSFDQALAALFADGLPQLVSSVPSFWRCYAATFFTDTPPPANASEAVQHCAATQWPRSPQVHFRGPEPESFTPPTVLQSADPRFTPAAAQLRLEGESIVYVTVEANGLPSEFQVIQPLGAGLDEETLQAAAHFTFHPATLDGEPVRSGFLVRIHYGVRQ